MRLTVYTDYALRLLMYLAVKDGGRATIGEIAAGYGISRNHLMKVAHQLGVAGYVETVRGRGGGLQLARSAESIGLGNVVRDTEPDMTLVPCFNPADRSCVIGSCCVLRQALQHGTVAFLETLDGYTLADLVQPRDSLRRMLSIAPARPSTACGRTRGGAEP